MEPKHPVDDILADALLPPADHSPVAVTDHSSNPTAAADEINARHVEGMQYPPPTERTRYYYDEDDGLDDDRPEQPLPGGELIRCSREKHTLAQAQEFFGRKRKELAWTVECPIYRTARFWCKRVWRFGQ